MTTANRRTLLSRRALLASVVAGSVHCVLGESADADPGADLAAPERRPGKPYVERVPATSEVRELYKIDVVEIPMVYIPAGTFVMGTPEAEAGHRRTESPQHRVRLGGFWMSQFEVTWDLFRVWSFSLFPVDMAQGADDPLFLRARRLAPRPHTRSAYAIVPHDKDLKYPVTNVSQYGAQNICRWLSLRTGRPYRLPTEAEWEYAARAGSSSPYAFGEDSKRLQEYAWFGEKLADGPHPVGRKKPNPWGLYDILGNVEEWTLDGWSDGYSDSAKEVAINPWTPRKKGSRWGVARGGSWMSRAEELRSGARSKVDQTLNRAEYSPRWYDPGEAGSRIGWRLVSPEEPDGDERATSVHALPERDVAPFTPPEEDLEEENDSKETQGREGTQRRPEKGRGGQ